MAQFTLKRLMVAIALMASACGMLAFLGRIAYKKSAAATLGTWEGIAAPLSSCLWIGSAIAVGVAIGVPLKHPKLGLLATLLVLIAVALWFQSPVEK